MGLLRVGSSISERSLHSMKVTCLHVASEQGHCNLVEWLLDNGCDLEEKDSDGKTALIYSANKSGNVDVMNLLLERGASIHASDKRGNTALFYAAKYHNMKQIQALMLYDCSLESTNNNGDTVFSINSKNTSFQEKISLMFRSMVKKRVSRF